MCIPYWLFPIGYSLLAIPYLASWLAAKLCSCPGGKNNLAHSGIPSYNPVPARSASGPPRCNPRATESAPRFPRMQGKSKHYNWKPDQ